jgi:DNA polymerase III epsilon subunit-like protein
MHLFNESPWIFLDCQTTGIDPQRGRVFEIAWALLPAGYSFASADCQKIEVQSSLLALPAGFTLSKRLTHIIAIDEKELAAAPPPETLWPELLNQVRKIFLGRRGIAVIHCASFETPFLADLHQRGGNGIELPWKSVCTLKISRKLLPGLTSHGIRAVSGHFGHFLEHRYDAQSHVRATLTIWRELRALLKNESIGSLETLENWLETKSKKIKPERNFLVSRQRRISLPDSPGIYKMTAKNGKVLYVGKATSLKQRVSSYFKSKGPLRLAEMMAQVYDVDYKNVATPLEAALVESDEIKKHQPPYNTLLLEQHRAIYFYSTDLRQISQKPSAAFPYGPFTSIFLNQGFLEWNLAAPETVLNEARRLGNVNWRPDSEQAFPFTLGLHFVRRLNNDFVDEADSEQESPLIEEMAPPQLAATLVRRVARTAVRLRTACWLCRLSECTVFFRESPQSPLRALQISRAQLQNAVYVANRDRLPLVANWRLTLNERRFAFDVAAYDRMRVLWTELLTVKRKGGDVEILLRPERTRQIDKYLKSQPSAPFDPDHSKDSFDAVRSFC